MVSACESPISCSLRVITRVSNRLVRLITDEDSAIGIAADASRFAMPPYDICPDVGESEMISLPRLFLVKIRLRYNTSIPAPTPTVRPIAAHAAQISGAQPCPTAHLANATPSASLSSASAICERA